MDKTSLVVTFVKLIESGVWGGGVSKVLLCPLIGFNVFLFKHPNRKSELEHQLSKESSEKCVKSPHQKLEESFKITLSHFNREGHEI